MTICISQTKTNQFFMVLIWVAVLALVMQPNAVSAADTGEKKTDLSTVNWDTEEEESDTGGVGGGNLSAGSWEDEDADPETEAENLAEDKKREDEYRVIEKVERVTQISGFLTFCVYLLGLLITAYFTRNRKLAVNYSPELLILLHTFWPLQWLLLPFFGQKVR